jgi:hypothetical protein
MAELLAFAGPPPDAIDLSRRWHLQLASGSIRGAFPQIRDDRR